MRAVRSGHRRSWRGLVQGVRAALLPALVAVALVGCTPIIRSHGYAPTDDELAALTLGKDTRETVTAAVGRPSAEGVLADGQWFYVQSRWEQVGPRAPVETSREVVALSFAPDGTLKNVERFGLQDGQVVALSRRVTESNIKGVTFVQQLLTNFGRGAPGQILGQ